MAKTDNFVTASFVLDIEDIKWLDEKVQTDDINRSQLVRRIMREARKSDTKKRKTEVTQ